MIDIRDARPAGAVTLIATPQGDPEHFAEALGCALRQTRDLEVRVVNDAPRDVAAVVARVADDRVHLLSRREGRPVADGLNEAIAMAEGRYVGYFDDRCLLYPHHVETLLSALADSEATCAYGNVYHTLTASLPSGRRGALGKHLDVRGHFDRLATLYYSRVPRCAMLHGRDVLPRAGGFDPHAAELLDWDLARKLCLHTDLLHVDRITGELCRDADAPPADEDPRTLADARRYVRSSRPPKPWPKLPDLAILYICTCADNSVAEAVEALEALTFYPHRVYLTAPLAGHAPNLTPVAISESAPFDARVDAALRKCDAERVAIVPHGSALGLGDIEQALTMIDRPEHRDEAILLDASPDAPLAAVLRREVLADARAKYPALPVRASLAAAGVAPRPVAGSDVLFRLGGLLKATGELPDGDGRAEDLCHTLARLAAEGPGAREEMARSLLDSDAPLETILELYEQANGALPTVQTLLAEARLRRQGDQPGQAVQLLRRASEALQWKGTP